MLRAALAIALLAACGAKAPVLEEKKLPGFTLGLPRGALAESDANTYTAGSVRLELFAHENQRITVKWWYTDKPEAKDISRDGDFLPLAPPGLSGLTTTVAFGDENIFATVFICDHRAISITTGINGAAAKSVHTAIVNSVKCTPEPNVKPAELSAIEIALPSSFKVQRTPALAYPTRTWLDEETGAVVTTSVVPDAGIARSYGVEAELKKQLTGMKDVEIVELERSGELASPDVKFSATAEQPILGYATATFCKEVNAYAVTIVLATSDEVAAPLYTTIQNGRCRSSLK